MAILGFNDYLCELCKYFNTDGIDGNHPYCMKQDIDNSKAVKLNEPCPYGWEFGIPTGYPSSVESNSKRARELLDKINSGHPECYCPVCFYRALFTKEDDTCWYYICPVCYSELVMRKRATSECLDYQF